MNALPLPLERLFSKPEKERRIGPFLLVRQLGRGGFAPVWLARETYGGETLRAAAVKLFSFAAEDAGSSRRIIEEARALCRVEHPNVVRFYSLAVDEDARVMGLGMEFVAGRSLASRLEHAGPMRVDQVVDLGLAMASALAAVHRAGIVHRDVKPGNIMETDRGYKLVDFGIASAAVTFPETTTWIPANDPEATGRVAALQSGTLGYVDPFMIAVGAPASATSDLYALGATLFECLTGRLPASTGSKTFDERILDGREIPSPVAMHGASIPPALAAIIDRMVSPDRALRYAAAEDVVLALERLKFSAPQPRPRFVPSRSFLGALVLVTIPTVGYWFVQRQGSPIENTPRLEASAQASAIASLAASAVPPSQTKSLSVTASAAVSSVEKSPEPKASTPSLRTSLAHSSSAPIPAAPSSTTTVVLADPPVIPSAAITTPPPMTSTSTAASANSKLTLSPARDW